MSSTGRRAHGPTVRALRTAQGLRLADLVDATGRSRGFLSNIENGRHGASTTTTLALADALHVTPDVLTGQIPPIEALRGFLGVTADNLAAAAGITVGALARIERGTERAHPHELARLATRLGVDPAVLDATADTTPARAS